MEDETREKIREPAKRRARTCAKCGSSDQYDATGSQVGGLVGIMYRVCGACGDARPLTKKDRRSGLLI